MFSNFAWSEMLVIACVAIIVVGPKDLPGMLRTFGKTLGSVKRLAGDFQRQFNDAIKETELDELKDLTSTSGFDPLKDAKASMEEMAKNIQDPTKSVPPANKVSQLDGPSGSAANASVKTDAKSAAPKASAKPAAKSKTTAKAKPATKTTATKQKSAAAKPRTTTKATAAKKPAAIRAAPKKNTAAASKAKAVKAKSAS